MDRRRGSAAARGYGAAWRALRADVLANEPLCRSCKHAGLVVAATDVDHIIPHKGDQALFWSRSNLQPLCASCHATKTATEDGGFGNARASADASTS